MLPGSGMDGTPGKGLVSPLPSRASAWNENKLKAFRSPKQKANQAHCNLDIHHY